MYGHAMQMAAPIAGGALTIVAIWAAFVGGLVGSLLHCSFMCAPLIVAGSLAEGAACAGRDGAGAGTAAPGAGSGAGARRAFWFQARFHTGRLVTYVLIGAALGLLAEANALNSIERSVGSERFALSIRVVATVALIATGVVMLLSALAGRSARLPELTAPLARSRWFRASTTWLASRRGWWALPLGMLMALLPCAPLLPFEMAALSSGHPGTGAMILLAFGLGTLPALVGAGFLADMGGQRVRRIATPLAAAAVLVLGFVALASLAPALG